MADIYLTNSLTGKKEKFEPLSPKVVGMYACGPTVHNYATIGNFRTYTVADIFFRLLGYNSFYTKYVMNLTDVGHLVGDSDVGDDKVEKSAKKKGKTAWDIAEYYTKIFLKDFEALNLRKPWKFPKATDHIKEQVSLVEKLEKKGFTYKITDGIYFDTKAFEKKTNKKYGELSTLDEVLEGARVRQNLEKKNARDFALWKFSKKPGERHMEWESPWGIGFPGWHIECSAMSMKYLGESFDIHIGGEDLRSTHHPNEIAQSEAVTNKPFVRYWIHVTFLKVDGKRMSKSLKNFYTISDLRKKGFDPIALRYLYLTAHYRDSLNFTWESMKAAQVAYDKLRNQVAGYRGKSSRTTLSQEKQKKIDDFRNRYILAICDDINTPKALAVFWEMLKSNIPSGDKYDLAISFDEVLGLGLQEYQIKEVKIPKEIQKLAEEREALRKAGKYEEGDKIRKSMLAEGYLVEDTPKGLKVKKIKQ
jgi:cysteinyl-tRNA synthetase